MKIHWRTLALTSLLCAWPLVLTAEQAQLPIPSGPKILTRLKQAHPRLLASANDFAELKKRIATDRQLKSWLADLRSQAQEILLQPVSRYEIPDGLRLLETSRRVKDRVYLLGLLYRLEGDRRLAKRAWQELEAAAKFPDWNPRHFLDTAEMTHAFAIGYDWFYDAWSPEQRTALHSAMVTKGFGPALAAYRTGVHGFWTKARHNWNQVCNGGIGMGALALGDVEPQTAGELLHAGLESLQLAMAEFAPDGAWKEGPGYWNYATSYNVVFLAALQTALGTDFGLSGMQGFSQTGFFPIYLTGPLNRTFNYADGGDHAIRAAQMFWFAAKFQQAPFAAFERKEAQPSPLDLLWCRPQTELQQADILPADKYYRGAEVASFRSDWDSSMALFLAFKAGDNKANHSHLDLGSFVFDASGVRWAVDLGSDDYNLPGYFGANRWDYYRLRAEGHNTLLINPGSGPDQDPSAASKIIRFESAPLRAFALADLTQAYQKQARRVWRGMAFLNRRLVLIQDEIQCDNPSEVWWFMHTPAKIATENSGKSALLTQTGARLRADILSPPDARFEAMDTQPLPGSPHPARQAKNPGIQKLAIHLQGVGETRLAVLLTPLSEEPESSRGSTPVLRALSEW